VFASLNYQALVGTSDIADSTTVSATVFVAANCGTSRSRRVTLLLYRVSSSLNLPSHNMLKYVLAVFILLCLYCIVSEAVSSSPTYVLCGNGVVDAGEQCDSSAAGGSSICCNRHCRARSGKVCNVRSTNKCLVVQRCKHDGTCRALGITRPVGAGCGVGFRCNSAGTCVQTR